MIIGYVSGNMVLVYAGDRVTADVRVIESNAFAVENAFITGESAPLSLTTATAQVPCKIRLISLL